MWLKDKALTAAGQERGNVEAASAIMGETGSEARNWVEEREKAPKFKGSADGLADQKRYDW